MKCPLCDREARRRSNSGHGTAKRYYYCGPCRHQFVTREVPLQDAEVAQLRIAEGALRIVHQQVTESARKVLRAKGYLR